MDQGEHGAIAELLAPLQEVELDQEGHPRAPNPALEGDRVKDNKHDPLCPLIKLSKLKSGCTQCDLINAGRQSAYKYALATIRYEFPKPTLGVQKIIAMLEARVDGIEEKS